MYIVTLHKRWPLLDYQREQFKTGEAIQYKVSLVYVFSCSNTTETGDVLCFTSRKQFITDKAIQYNRKHCIRKLYLPLGVSYLFIKEIENM